MVTEMFDWTSPEGTNMGSEDTDISRLGSDEINEGTDTGSTLHLFLQCLTKLSI